MLRIFVLALSLLLHACGGGSAPAPEPPSPTGPGGPTTPSGPAPSDPPQVSIRELITTAQSISVPLTNGRGLTIADVPVTLHAEDGTLFATRWSSSGTQKTPLATGAGGATLAGEGQQLLVVYADLAGNAMRARVSTDGGQQWGDPVRLGDRPAGPPLPTACVYSVQGQLRRVVAWSAQPSESDGPLVLVLFDGTQWLPPVIRSDIRSSGASLHCSASTGAEIVWRDHRAGAQGMAVALWSAQVTPAGTLEGAGSVMSNAFDPSFCRSGGTRWLGHHSTTNDAHLSYNQDGTGWTEVDTQITSPGIQPLDESGKFVSVACAGSIVLASWGDWPSKQEANDRTASRRLGVLFSRSGASHWLSVSPAGLELDQGPATTAATEQGAWVAWKAGKRLRLAEIR